MKIEVFSLGILGADCYVIQNEETKEAVMVDPGGTSKKLRNYLQEQGVKPTAILLTHGHFDHMLGIREILQDYEVPVYVYGTEDRIIENPELNLSSIYTDGYGYQGASEAADGQIIEEAGFRFKVIHTPGHTSDSCCYYVEEEGVLFSGDTLFCGSVGRSDLPTGSEATLYRSIREKLYVLPDETKVFPGHSAPTTVGAEKVQNPYVSGN